MRRALLLGLLVPCLAAASAGAKVPTFGPKTIVPGQSIGGVKLGMTKAQASVTWRSPDRCQDHRPVWCNYVALSTLSTPALVNPFAGFHLMSGRVVAVGIEDAENPAVNAKVKQLKTAKGIRVGSTMAAARKAYHLPPPSGGEAQRSRAIYRQRGGLCTLFYSPSPPYSIIDGIHVGKCGVGGLG